MWRLVGCVAASKLCGSWQAVAVGDLYTITELCGSWQVQVVCRWELEAPWPLASYIPLASCVTVGKLCGSWRAVWQPASYVVASKLWRLAICTPLASCVMAGKLYAVGKLCGRW